MVNPKFSYDHATGKLEPVLATVVVGHERINSMGTSRLSSQKFVICEEHLTAPATWVRNRGVLVRCCKLCIEKYCRISSTIPSSTIEDGS